MNITYSFLGENSLSITLLVEPNPQIESLFMLNLSTWLGLEIIGKKRAEFAINYLMEGKKVDLIIVRNTIGKEASANSLIDYLQQNNLEIPLIVIGQSGHPLKSGHFAHLPNSLELKPLIQTAAHALKITAQDMARKIVPEFFPIPILYFKEIKRSVCPVYSQDFETEEYIKRSEANIDFDSALINTMIEEGVSHLFVKKLDRLQFVTNVTAELMNVIPEEEVNSEESLSIASKAVQLLGTKLTTIGVTEETIELANKNLARLKKTSSSHPKLASLLEKMIKNKSGYLFKHTQILTYVCLHIIKNIDWGSPEQEEKVCFISLFHDIVLETDEMAEIHSTKELRTAKISSQQRMMVERHAQMSAEIVARFPHSPMGADQIIRQHHGMLNGIGFSEHYGANVSPVAIVFIVSEEFTRIVLKRETGPFNIQEMIGELKQVFPTSRFQKVIALLESITF